jgi:type II secretory pathway pseudopilin PulG
MTPTQLRSRSRGRSAAMSLLELMISISIMSLVMLMTVPAMVYFARVFKGTRTETLLFKDCNQFIQEMDYKLTSANEVEYLSDKKIRIKGTQGQYIPDASQPTGYRFETEIVIIDLEYIDTDNKPATIKDNYLQQTTTRYSVANVVLENTQKRVFTLASPAVAANGTPIAIFKEVAGDTRPALEMTLRIGDRVYPTTDADDRITGPGYQGYLVHTYFVAYNNPA